MAAYFLWHNRILDADKMQEYLSKALVTMAPYHPEVVVFDERAHALEGNAPGPRTIVIKFDSRLCFSVFLRTKETLAPQLTLMCFRVSGICWCGCVRMVTR